MYAKRNGCLLAMAIFLFATPALAQEAAPVIPGSRIDFRPLPLQIFMYPGQKPAAVFTTPCIQIERATHGFPPFMAFENFMFEMIGKINDSEVLPVRLEPVCI